MDKRDIVIGSITNYKFDQIKHWVNSLDRSGFDGLKAVICYNVDFETCEELASRGYTIFGFNRNDEKKRLEYNRENFNICLERFLHTWYFLSKLSNKEQYRYVIATDVKDVVFQSNPSDWMTANFPSDKKLGAASESIQYKNEPWGRDNIRLSFGNLIAEQKMDNVIYNAGTICGEFNAFIDLCLNIYLACGRSPESVPGGGGPDQAALNVLLSTIPYSDITKFFTSEDGYAAQLGTTGPQVEHQFGEFLLSPPPILNDDGLVCTSTGTPFMMVHQYDRVKFYEWDRVIRAKYE